ncbi:hypothetical protein BU17DRAFT_66165 [Hysterangium stoloniferum]|nr:hypothetical protein BU17DRAFT_66165 [Hysterangium stoloniferum]
MPASQRNEIAQKRRRDRNAISPYNQTKRKEKMMASRGWGPSIWDLLAFWRSNKEPEEEMNIDEEEADETDEAEEAEETPDNDQSADLSGAADESVSMMNTSTISEDQVEATAPQKRPPYVAPLPPSSSQRQFGPYSDPIAKVSEYLETVVRPRGGECTDIEALGLSVLIQSSVNQSTSAEATLNKLISSPFSFPAFNTPFPLRPTFTTPETNLAALLSPKTGYTKTPITRTLAQNPNGPLFYRGGGSARPRYRSPAFASSSPRKKILFPSNFGDRRMDAPNGHAEPASPSDGKRRRVGEEKDSSVAQPSGLASESESSTATQEPTDMVGTINGTVTSNSNVQRTLRFNPPPRLTASTPVKPSPLRQTVRADSSSPGSPNSSVNGVNGTTPNGSKVASDILAHIIEEATPPKPKEPTLEDNFRNPYQRGTKRARKTITKVVRPPPLPPRPTRYTETASSTVPESPKKLSAFETIQRTAPQPASQTASKRSLGVATIPQGEIKYSGAGSSDNPVIIELDDDDDEPPTKRQKATNESERETGGTPREAPEAPITIDVDVDMDAGDASATRPSEVVEPMDQEAQKRQEVKRALFPSTLGKGRRLKSVPKEPSPLRQSFQPGEPPSPPMDAAVKSDDQSKSGENGNSIFGSGLASFGSETSAFKPANPFGSTTTTTAASIFESKTTRDVAPLFGPTAVMQATLGPSSGLFGSPTSAAPSFGAPSISFAAPPSISFAAPPSISFAAPPSSISDTPAKALSFSAISSISAPSVPSINPLFGASSHTSERPTFKVPSTTSSIAHVFGSYPPTTSIFPPVNSLSSLTAASPIVQSAFEPPVPIHTSFATPAPLATTSVTETDVLALARAEVLRMPASSLPKFEFPMPSPTPSVPEHTAARIAAQNVSDNDLPKYDFQAVKSPFSGQVKPSSESVSIGQRRE